MGQSLEHYLMNLQKSDMEYNALIFGEKIPMSWNKEKMSKRLAEIYEQNIDEFLSIFSMYVLFFIQEIHKKRLNGKIHAYDNDETNNILVNELCDQLEPWGLIEYNAGMITIPDMLFHLVKHKMKAAESQIIEWQEMELYAQGIINTYGLLEEEHLLSILNDCFPDMRREDIKSYLLRRTHILSIAKQIPVEKQIWWFEESIDDVSGWYWAMQNRKEIPYRIYTREEYMQAALDGLPKRPKNTNALVKILCCYGMSEEEAEDCLMEAAIDHCQTLDIKHGLPEFLQEIDWESKDDIQHFIDLFMEFENDTPLWFNKGNAPTEVFSNKQMGKDVQAPLRNNVIEFPKKPKIGRNEPCPCGSGKKYKNCCARADKDE